MVIIFIVCDTKSLNVAGSPVALNAEEINDTRHSKKISRYDQNPRNTKENLFIYLA
jgi:hypothetical protein